MVWLLDPKSGDATKAPTGLELTDSLPQTFESMIASQVRVATYASPPPMEMHPQNEEENMAQTCKNQNQKVYMNLNVWL